LPESDQEKLTSEAFGHVAAMEFHLGFGIEYLVVSLASETFQRLEIQIIPAETNRSGAAMGVEVRLVDVNTVVGEKSVGDRVS
jgi:hypothetical protein